jgi:hypothetical protein
MRLRFIIALAFIVMIMLFYMTRKLFQHLYSTAKV